MKTHGPQERQALNSRTSSQNWTLSSFIPASARNFFDLLKTCEPPDQFLGPQETDSLLRDLAPMAVGARSILTLTEIVFGTMVRAPWLRTPLSCPQLVYTAELPPDATDTLISL